jgi:hypothetical protein
MKRRDRGEVGELVGIERLDPSIPSRVIPMEAEGDVTVAEAMMLDKKKEDAKLSRLLREQLNRDYDFLFFKRSPDNELRLGIRIPKDVVDDMSLYDIVSIKKRIDKTLEMVKDHLSAIYIVCDSDYLRLRPEVFLKEILGVG